MGKKLFLFALVFVSILSVNAQNTQAKPLAPFDITLINNKNLRAFELKKNEPVMLMYFSPDCDHCKELTKEILKSAKTFGNKQLIMVLTRTHLNYWKKQPIIHLTLEKVN